MKDFIIVFLLLVSTQTFAEKKEEEVQKDPKIFSQVEFDKKMAKDVSEKIDEAIKKITPKNLTKFSKELLEKEKKLIQKERNILSREKELELSSKNFTVRTNDLENRHQKVLGCIKTNETQHKERVKKLVKVISNMKPVNAANVLSAQEANLSVQILSGLDAVKIAKIFNLMEKEVSARLQKQYINMKR